MLRDQDHSGEIKQDKGLKSDSVGSRGQSAALLDREVVEVVSVRMTTEQKPEICEPTMWI